MKSNKLLWISIVGILIFVSIGYFVLNAHNEFYTEKKVYASKEPVTFILDSNKKYFDFYEVDIYKLENNTWQYLNRNSADVETCLNNEIFVPRSVMGVDVPNMTLISHTTFVWDQKHYVPTGNEEVCGNQSYMPQELTFAEPGTYKATLNARVYDANICTPELILGSSNTSFNCASKTFETEFEII